MRANWVVIATSKGKLRAGKTMVMVSRLHSFFFGHSARQTKTEVLKVV